jgi:hypothetical protein
MVFFNEVVEILAFHTEEWATKENTIDLQGFPRRGIGWRLIHVDDLRNAIK